MTNLEFVYFLLKTAGIAGLLFGVLAFIVYLSGDSVVPCGAGAGQCNDGAFEAIIYPGVGGFICLWLSAFFKPKDKE